MSLQFAFSKIGNVGLLPGKWLLDCLLKAKQTVLCNLSDDKPVHASDIKPVSTENDWLVAQSDAFQSFAFLLNNSLK